MALSTGRIRRMTIMTIISGYTTLLAIQATFFVGQSSARRQRGHLFGSSKRVGWEIKSHAGVPLTTSSQTLESFLMQVRGGSSYDDDDRRKPQQGGYYDDDGYGKGFDSRDWEGDGYQDDRDYNRDDGYSGNNRNSYDDYDDRGSSSVSLHSTVRQYWFQLTLTYHYPIFLAT